MTTVGEILHNKRLERKLDLPTVEKATKIRVKFLVALENNEFDKLPPGTFTRGFIKNYAVYLGLPVEETLAFYRRAASEEKLSVKPYERVKIGRWALTPQLFTAIGIGTLVVAFFAYLVLAYFQFAGSPPLLVTQPENNSVVREERVEVVGKTDPEATVTINDQVVPVSENGSFAATVPLSPGLNTLIITTTNKYKHQTTLSRNVRLEK
ncbi:helix-turn-helix domain-containing protein [Candidatus Microgenomates bacterium]|nr:helix-turn-helix domain-containing protein [Candidatus Microgenomates bacterium]